MDVRPDERFKLCGQPSDRLTQLLFPHITDAVFAVWNPYTDSRKVGVKFLRKSDAEPALEHMLTLG